MRQVGDSLVAETAPCRGTFERREGEEERRKHGVSDVVDNFYHQVAKVRGRGSKERAQTRLGFTRT